MGRVMCVKQYVEAVLSVVVTFSTINALAPWKAATPEFSNEIDALSTIEAWKTKAFIDVYKLGQLDATVISLKVLSFITFKLTLPYKHLISMQRVSHQWLNIKLFCQNSIK